MKHKPVKIVATIGPATHSEEKILQLAQAGVDVFRINFSHATIEEAVERIIWIRKVEEQLGKPLAVMGDLPGPKIRISDMEPDTILEKGQQFIISKKIEKGDKNGCGLNHPSIIDFLEEGAEVYIDDGTIKLVIEKKLKDAIETKVVVGGLLKPKKGFSAEGISLSTTGLSAREKDCIRAIVEYKGDALAASFVQSEKDIQEVKKLLPENSKILLIAKIETANGVKNAEKILEEADGIMVARGDLGLAVPIAQVPFIQKQLIDLCVRNAKPVITATQMLESMISKPIPTRAEVGDVANAILDRTDAVMLSAETAEGKFPVETVEMMSKIIDETVRRLEPYEYHEVNTLTNAMSDSAGKIAEQIGAKLIIAFTRSGVTARRVSRHRHKQPIIALSIDPTTLRRLNFTWGVYPKLIHETTDFSHFIGQARKLALKTDFVHMEKGDPFVIVAGIPFNESGSTNLIYVEKV